MLNLFENAYEPRGRGLRIATLSAFGLPCERGCDNNIIWHLILPRRCSRGERCKMAQLVISRTLVCCSLHRFI